MKHRILGGTGISVSEYALGAMMFGSMGNADHDDSVRIIHRALDAGINFVDTADIYSSGESEEIVGKALKGRRDEVVLATKANFSMGPDANQSGNSRRWLVREIENSLRRLGTDHIDLYQIHRWDPDTPIEETMCALHDAVRAGKVRYVGASLMYAWQCAKAQHTALARGWTPFVSMQTRYNLLYREEEREMLPYCADAGLGVLPYSPLAQGALAVSTVDTARSAVREVPNDNPDIIAALTAIAAERGVPPARIALAWLLGKPGVVAPIVGATKASHLADALAAESVTLTPAEAARLEKPYQPQQPYGYT